MSSKHIIVILDESGSMDTIRKDVIDGMNEFMKEQKKVEPDINHQIKYTFVKFSWNVKKPLCTTLADVEDITYEDYYPNGGTALYDAIGMTLEPIKEERNVCVMIITDGMENSSRKYNQKDVFNMIRDLEADKGWKFAYLSCDIDTWSQGNNLGFAHNTVVSQDDDRRLMCSGTIMNYCTPGVNQLGKHIASDYNNRCFATMRTSGTATKADDNIISSGTEINYRTPGIGQPIVGYNDNQSDIISYNTNKSGIVSYNNNQSGLVTYNNRKSHIISYNNNKSGIISYDNKHYFDQIRNTPGQRSVNDAFIF